MSKLSDIYDTFLILWGVSWSWAMLIERIEGAAAFLTAIAGLILLVLRIVYWWRRLNDRKRENPSDMP